MDLLTGEMVIAKGRCILSIIQHMLLSGIIRVRVAQSSDMEFGGGPTSHRNMAGAYHFSSKQYHQVGPSLHSAIGVPRGMLLSHIRLIHHAFTFQLLVNPCISCMPDNR